MFNYTGSSRQKISAYFRGYLFWLTLYNVQDIILTVTININRMYRQQSFAFDGPIVLNSLLSALCNNSLSLNTSGDNRIDANARYSVQTEGITVRSCCPTQSNCSCTPSHVNADESFHWSEARRQMATDTWMTTNCQIWTDVGMSPRNY